MKKILFLSLVLMFASAFAFAQDPQNTQKPMAKSKPAAMKTMEMKGTIIDNLCAGQNKDKLAEFIKTHTKECALMPNCKASGYSIYTKDGMLTKFDKTSNEKIAQFLKKKASKLDVVVKVTKKGDLLHLVSIKNDMMMKSK